jgi:hypothetical protein
MLVLVPYFDNKNRGFCRILSTYFDVFMASFVDLLHRYSRSTMLCSRRLYLNVSLLLQEADDIWVGRSVGSRAELDGPIVRRVSTTPFESFRLLLDKPVRESNRIPVD